MKTNLAQRIQAALMAVVLLTPQPALLARHPAPPPPAQDEEDDEEIFELSSFEVTSCATGSYSAATTIAGTRISTSLGDVGGAMSAVSGDFLGATPGGAQDINFFRMGAGRGQIPHPNTITAEGLFSEHDLPLEIGERGQSLFCVQTAAVPARFEVLPEIRYLAQLGFSSGLRADSWQPAPLNLIAVVDKSGSMSGEPLALVRASLISALGHMRDGDQLSIILYGDRSHVHLAATKISAGSRSRIADAINAIESSGSTFMEAGLQLGYQVARESAGQFDGTTRVMLFTDERPNVGNTAAQGFMAMAESASHDGIGLTTIGVGVQFGAELATKISSVRGGNLFFFEDATHMTKTFADDFDTMVTELAHDFSIRIAPSAGLRIAGVFGLPAEALQWDGDAIELDVATIFLSKSKGGIYFGLADKFPAADLPAPHATSPGAALAEIDFSYEEAGSGQSVDTRATCRLLDASRTQLGLTRGVALVDEYLSLKKAAQLHLLENDQESAFRLTSGLLGRLQASPDAALEPERTLVRNVHNTLALLSGHTAEIQTSDPTNTLSPLAGVWRRSGARKAGDNLAYLVVWANGVIEPVLVEEESDVIGRGEPITLEGNLPATPRGRLALAAETRERFRSIRYSVSGDRLKLRVAELAGGSTSFTFSRATFADILDEENPDREYEIDSLSGLPISDSTATRS